MNFRHSIVVYLPIAVARALVLSGFIFSILQYTIKDMHVRITLSPFCFEYQLRLY